jgi:hypothetical protein
MYFTPSTIKNHPPSSSTLAGLFPPLFSERLRTTKKGFSLILTSRREILPRSKALLTALISCSRSFAGGFRDLNSTAERIIHCCQKEANLEVDGCDILPQRHPGCAVNYFHSDGRFTLGLQDVIHQILGRKVDITSPVGVVLAQHTLRIQAPQAPAAAKLLT